MVKPLTKVKIQLCSSVRMNKAKDRTVPCERSIGSNFSASGKFVRCGVNVHAALISRTTFCMKLTLFGTFDVIVRLRREIPWRLEENVHKKQVRI